MKRAADTAPVSTRPDFHAEGAANFADVHHKYELEMRGRPEAERKRVWVETVAHAWRDGGGRMRTAFNSMVAEITEKLKNLSDPLVFLMELIQNASDARYDDGVRPSFDFYLQKDDPSKTPGCDGAAIIVTNEAGFSDEDVWELSGIGLSSKLLKKRQGRGNSIGEKGMGFKSVFRISPRPTIISNGFAFYYEPVREKNTGVPFVVPQLVNDNALIKQFTTVRWLSFRNCHLTRVFVMHQGRFAGKTVVLLPLLARLESGDTGVRASLSAHLVQLLRAPEMMLFLPKLQHLRLHVQG